MKIVEMFQSVQGEGKTQGVNSLFIRFPGCNLSCHLCCDIDTTKYLNENLDEINAKDLQIDDVLLTPFGKTKIINLEEDNSNDCFEIELESGKKLICTSYHKVFNKFKKEICVKNLKIGDYIMTQI